MIIRVGVLLIIVSLMAQSSSAADNFQMRAVYYSGYDNVCTGGGDYLVLNIDVDGK